MARASAHWIRLLALVPAAVASLGAQNPPAAPAVTSAGDGAETWVLLSGLVGGVAGFRRLEARLLAHGARVVIIDPYNLSLDSAEVTFAALARRVDALLAAQGITGAHVVGHSHGGGVALRLAANHPARVADLYLLDVGALDAQGSSTFTGALRLLPIIERLPGGHGLLRQRLLRGVERSAGRGDWLDARSRRDYAEPLLAELGRAVALGLRLAAAHEPEPLAATVARVRVPVTVLLGDAPHLAGATPGEVAALAPLGSQLAVEHLPGIGHFPHEEAPDDLAARLRAGRSPVVVARAGGRP